jgi:hypothetical protein
MAHAYALPTNERLGQLHDAAKLGIRELARSGPSTASQGTLKASASCPRRQPR